MLEQYRVVFGPVDALCQRLGINLVRDETFVREYRRPSDGFRILLEGDRGAEGCYFDISWPGHHGRGYATWLLMEAFGERLPAERRTPTIGNQVWFVETCLDDILHDEVSYKAEYDRLNQPPDWLSQ